MGMPKTDEVQSIVVLNAVDATMKALVELRAAMGQISLTGGGLTVDEMTLVSGVFTDAGSLVQELANFPTGPFSFVEVK